MSFSQYILDEKKSLVNKNTCILINFETINTININITF